MSIIENTKKRAIHLARAVLTSKFLSPASPLNNRAKLTTLSLSMKCLSVTDVTSCATFSPTIPTPLFRITTLRPQQHSPDPRVCTHCEYLPI